MTNTQANKQIQSTPVVQDDGLIYPDDELYGGKSSYLETSDAETEKKFLADHRAARLIIESGIVNLSNVNNTTLRAAACVLAQLGMANADMCRSAIRQGVMTMGISTSHLFWHPQFVLDNFSNVNDTQKLNALLLHEVMHYIDGDSTTSMTIALGNSDLKPDAVTQLNNVVYDISHDAGLSDLMCRDSENTLGNYVDKKMLASHAEALVEQLREYFTKQDKCNDDVLTLFDDWADKTARRELTKAEAAAKLIGMVRLVLPEPPEDGQKGEGAGDGIGQVHVISNPETSTDENGNETTDTSGNVPAPSQQDIADADEDRQANLSKAAQMAGDTGALKITRFKAKPNKTIVPWKQMLTRLMTDSSKGNKPNIRYPYQPELHRGIVLPTKRDPQASATVIFDVSGSMFMGGLSPLEKFLSEMHGALSSSVNRLDIIPFDHGVHKTLTFNKSTANELLDIEIPGGGGTTMGPPLAQMHDENLLRHSQALLIITDLYLQMPEPSELPARTHKVIWLVREDGNTTHMDTIKKNPGKYGSLILMPMGRRS